MVFKVVGKNLITFTVNALRYAEIKQFWVWKNVMMEIRFHSMDVINAKFDVKNNVFFVNFGFVKLVSSQDGFLINIINPQLSVEMAQLLIHMSNVTWKQYSI